MPENATVKEVMAFFGMSAGEFAREWKLLTDSDKAALKAGIGSQSFTY